MGEVFVCSGGQIKGLSSDKIDLRQIGKVQLKRASHVDGSADLSTTAIMWLCAKGSLEQKRLFSLIDELTDQQRLAFLAGVGLAKPEEAIPEHVDMLRASLPSDIWWADLSPSKGPVLGPFDTRQAALDAEVAWLRVHEFKVSEIACNETGSSGKV